MSTRCPLGTGPAESDLEHDAGLRAEAAHRAGVRRRPLGTGQAST
ncbi:hypothetical protein [Streptomyces sp. NPDC017086]